MRALIQRVSQANVRVDGEITGEIDQGLLILLGVGKNDGLDLIGPFAGKIARLRIFDDESGRMNRSLQDIGGSALVVSQFTLFADSRKGNRPSYTAAALPEHAVPLYEAFIEEFLQLLNGRVASGVFGADMKVSLVNDGPVTIWLDTERP